MFKKLFVIAICIGMTLAQKEEGPAVFTPSDGPDLGTKQVSVDRGTATITQSTDTSTITSLNSVACPADDDSYMRRFDLSGDHGIVNQFTVSNVQFGVETATNAQVTVNLYSIPKASALTFANLTLLGTANSPVFTEDLTVRSINVSGVLANPNTHDLVVEVFAADFTAGFNFFIGSNANGQLAPSFLASSGCGAAEPTDVATLGFPDMHIVMLVDGEESIPIPTLGQMGMWALVGLLLVSAIFIRRRNMA